jgi:hypothetical protein
MTSATAIGALQHGTLADTRLCHFGAVVSSIHALTLIIDRLIVIKLVNN